MIKITEEIRINFEAFYKAHFNNSDIVLIRLENGDYIDREAMMAWFVFYECNKVNQPKNFTEMEIPQWVKNTDPYNYEFQDGDIYLFAVPVKKISTSTGESTFLWEIEKVRVSCDDNGVEFYYHSDGLDEQIIWDAWDFSSVNYYIKLSEA